MDYPIQFLGLDAMELLFTTYGNKYLIAFQDLFTKWPMEFPTLDQKTVWIVRLLAKEIVPLFSITEALLFDTGINLLSIKMQDVCKLLGIKKLKTTAHHPQCNGMIKRLNCAFKTMLQKQAANFKENGKFTYQELCRPTLTFCICTSTGEKPFYLLFGYNCCSLTEAALLPASSYQSVNINNYREELVVMLSSAS